MQLQHTGKSQEQTHAETGEAGKLPETILCCAPAFTETQLLSMTLTQAVLRKLVTVWCWLMIENSSISATAKARHDSSQTD